MCWAAYSTAGERFLGSAGMSARCFWVFRIMLHHEFRFHGSLAASDEGSCQ
jgi:hypothetical protein